MYDDILIPTDGSREAERALARAFEFARTSDATIHVIHVVDTGLGLRERETDTGENLRELSEKRGREAAARIEEQATDRGFDTRRVVEQGVPYREILGYVDENDVDLVVMGTRGRTRDDATALGSTTERAITFAEVPVLAVPPAGAGDASESRATTYDHVLLPTDGSDAAERAATEGLDVAERYDADVHAIYVVDSATYGFEDAPSSLVGLLKEGGRKAVDEVAAEARERDLSVTTDVLRGVPHDEIREYAVGVDADLIVIGTRGRTPETDRLLGSTTARVIRLSNRPVLVSP